ncbi:hypothetical protein [Lyngbya sp. PCC 8106]|uniref:hypothetical protein n=1 Tax=Lyngbya sp. (strain PCC 8106) TaxID=313612 RepID=UPI0000EAC766|nr:hypothetical protein [Lyngbya sp. PCC 8106]EAW38697.1 copper-transporting ATPase, P-type (CopB) [Lyngbya sp. PCC 8106]
MALTNPTTSAIALKLMGDCIAIASPVSRDNDSELLFWATGYNVIGIPLAAGIAAPLGIILSPAVGAILMSISTVVVSMNAMLLRRVRLHD